MCYYFFSDLQNSKPILQLLLPYSMDFHGNLTD